MGNKYFRQDFDIEKAIKIYESGKTQTEVAAILGTTQKIVHQRFKRAGYKCRIAKKRNQCRENNDSWRGESASYAAFHYRIKALFGNPKRCEICGTTDPQKHYDWANLTGDYPNLQDYKRMCRSCHWKYDDKKTNFKGAIGGRPSRQVMINA